MSASLARRVVSPRVPVGVAVIAAAAVLLGGCAAGDQTRDQLGSLNNRARALAGARDPNVVGDPALVDAYRAFAAQNRLNSQTYVIRDEGGAVTFAPGDGQFTSFPPLLGRRKPGPVGSLYAESPSETCVVSRRAGNVWELYCVGLPENKKDQRSDRGLAFGVQAEGKQKGQARAARA